MALALAKGFVSAGLLSPSQILASAPSDTNLKTWREFKAETTHDNIEVIKKCDMISRAKRPRNFARFEGSRSFLAFSVPELELSKVEKYSE